MEAFQLLPVSLPDKSENPESEGREGKGQESISTVEEDSGRFRFNEEMRRNHERRKITEKLISEREYRRLSTATSRISAQMVKTTMSPLSTSMTVKAEMMQ